MSAPSLVIRGHSVAHLGSFVLSCPCTPVGRDLSIEVTFTNHCYTCGFDPAVHVPAEIDLYDQRRVGRVFDPVRYALSQGLPAIIAGLPESKVNQTPSQRNYVYATTVTVPAAVDEVGAAVTYQVFFSLTRAPKEVSHDLRLTVESAYPPEGPVQVAKRPNSIRFKVLALKILKGERVTFSAR